MNGYLRVLPIPFWNIKFSEYKSNMQIFRLVTEKKMWLWSFTSPTSTCCMEQYTYFLSIQALGKGKLRADCNPLWI